MMRTAILALSVAAATSIESTATDVVGKRQKKKILSFGGNGMLGSETLSRLITTDEYDIVLVSRGSWPHDSSDIIKPFVRPVTCDRARGLQNCGALMDDMENTEEYYAVLDFSGYNPAWVKNAADVLKGKVRVYLYVSTDSIYEVCEEIEGGVGSRRTRESDDKRPKDSEKREWLNEDDDYGHKKLAGEEVLVRQRKLKGGFPYVFLRFADVIGPRDGTDRFPTYFIWAKFYHDLRIPFHVPYETANQRQSLTYSGDAAVSIITALSKPEHWDEAYNIAFAESFSHADVLHKLAEVTGLGDVDVKVVPTDESISLYASVQRGPLDISKARERLGFTPTPVYEALKNTVEWYTGAFWKEEERDTFVEEFVNDIIESKASCPDRFTRRRKLERLRNAVDNELKKFSDNAEARGAEKTHEREL